MRGKVFGVLPYDFESLSLEKLRDRMWNLLATASLFRRRSASVGPSTWPR
jgi:hypothetical protein